MFGALIVADDSRYGAASIVRDTSTGLDWLNLTKTVNLSYNTVFGNLVLGGTFEGFRYANLPEIRAFFADANIPNIDQDTNANFQPVSDLLGKIGTLAQGFSSASSLALNAQSLMPGTHSLSDMRINSTNNLIGGAITAINLQWPDDTPSNIGSFIIRQTPPVPEPSTFTLLGLGVLACGWCRGMRAIPKRTTGGVR
jgi:hypothetical protein